MVVGRGETLDHSAHPPRSRSVRDRCEDSQMHRVPKNNSIRLRLGLCTALAGSAILWGASDAEAKATYITFQVLNNVTTVSALNAGGDTAGYYYDNSSIAH